MPKESEDLLIDEEKIINNESERRGDRVDPDLSIRFSSRHLQDIDDGKTTADNKENKTPRGKQRVELELGDTIVSVGHSERWVIEYIDPQRIDLRSEELGIKSKTPDEVARFLDAIPDGFRIIRASQPGYARQHRLLDRPRTNVRVHFQGTSQGQGQGQGQGQESVVGTITDLVEDMIEITYDTDKQIYIDFAYQGLPDYIEKIDIEYQDAEDFSPHSPEISPNKFSPHTPLITPPQTPEGTPPPYAYINYEDEEVAAVNGVEQVLREIYINEADLLGEEFIMYEEIPEGEKRYAVDAQMADLMDHWITKIPAAKQTPRVLERIHRVIEKYKEMRRRVLVTDAHGLVTGKTEIADQIPYDAPFSDPRSWILPVFAPAKKLYYYYEEGEKVGKKYEKPDENSGEEKEALIPMEGDLKEQGRLEKPEVSETATPYELYLAGLHDNFVPFRNQRRSQQGEAIQVTLDQDMLIVSPMVLKGKGSGNENNKWYNNAALKKDEVNLTPFDGDMRQRVLMDDTTVTPLVIRGVSVVSPPLGHAAEGRYSLILDRVFHRHHHHHHHTNNGGGDGDGDGDNRQHKDIEAWTAHRPTYAHLLEKYAETMGHTWTLSDKKVTVMEYAHFFNSVWFQDDYLRDSLLKTARKYIELCRESVMTLLKSATTTMKNDEQANKHYSDLQKNEVFAWADSADRDITTTFFSNLRRIYGIDEKTHTTGESLSHTLSTDCGELLYDMMQFILQYLVTPEKLIDVSMTPSIDGDGEDSSTLQNPLFSARLSKIYTSLDSLKKDNQRTTLQRKQPNVLLVDPELDDTPYSLYAEEYEPRLSAEFEDPVKFRAFLLQSLRDREKVTDPHLAESIADAWLLGNRAVEPGDYAILEETPPPLAEELFMKKQNRESMETEARIKRKTTIYQRSADGTAWIKSPTASIDKDAEKEIMEQYHHRNRRSKRSMLSPTWIKQSMKRSMKELAATLSRRMEARVFYLSWKSTIEDEQHVRVSRRLSMLGLKDLERGTNNTASTESPYEGIRQQILSEPDFAMKQHYIVRFYTRFCREAGGSAENIHWGYCRETNVPLFPRSLYDLAVAFSQGKYGETLDRIIARQGVESGDGDAIIDRHTNYVLKRKDNVIEDEYDEGGFKVVTRSMVENEMGGGPEGEPDEEGEEEGPAGEEEGNLSNPVAQKVLRVFRVMKKLLGLPANNESVEKMVVTQSMRFLCQSGKCETNTLFFMSADEFNSELKREKEKENKQANKQANKQTNKRENKQANKPGKNVTGGGGSNEDEPAPLKERPDFNYTHYMDRNIICVTLSMFLVAIQTATPPIRPRLSIPGCIYSYGGFPLTSNSDMSGLQFLSCFLFKYAKQGDQGELWKSIHAPYSAERMTNLSAAILSRLIEDVKDVALNEAYRKKRLYILTESQRVVPENLGRWSSFLPPMVNFTIENRVSREKTIVLRSNVSMESYRAQNMLRGYATVENIRTIVSKEPLLLPNIYQQNACCFNAVKNGTESERDDTHPLTFFAKRNEIIRADMVKVAQNDIHIHTMETAAIHSPMLFFVGNGNIKETAAAVGATDHRVTSKTAIYAAFIHHCRYDYGESPDADCAEFCKELPETYRADASLEEKIAALEEAKIFYGLPDLHKLMARVSRRIVINERADHSQKLIDLLKRADADADADADALNIIDEEVAVALKTLLEAVPVHPEKEQNNNYSVYEFQCIDAASQAIDKKHEAIVKFLKDKKYPQGNNDLENTIRMLNSIKRDTRILENENATQNHRFVKNAVYELLDCFTNQVLESTLPHMDFAATHWNFSERHGSLLKEKLNKYNTALNSLIDVERDEQNSLYEYLREVVPPLREYAEWIDVLPQILRLRSYADADADADADAIFFILLKYLWFSVIYGLVKGPATNTIKNNKEPNEEQMRLVSQFVQASLSIISKNREAMNYDYARIRAEVFKSKEKEKLGLVERIGNMNRFEKGVDKLKRKLKLGDYYVDPDFYKNPDFMEMRQNGVLGVLDERVPEEHIGGDAEDANEYGYDQADPDYGGDDQYDDGGEDGEVGF